MIYLNNAGTSFPKPPEVARAVAEALSASPADHGDLLRSARAAICGFLGLADPGRLILTPGCTSALAVALEDLPWEPGDGVITSSVEHHALARPVQRLAASRGVVHHQAPYRPGEPIDLGFVEEKLRTGGVRLVAVTGASNVTGEILPVENLAEMAHRRGALLLVDAAQTVGVIPVDLSGKGADIAVFAGHKGPLGPQGVGGLWAAPHVQFRSPSAACEIGPGGNGPEVCSTFPGACDVGSMNLPGVAGLAAGMGWLASRPSPAEGDSPRDLAASLACRVAELPGAELLGGRDAARTATVSMHLPGLPVEKAEAFFRERRIIVRAGQHCAPWALRALGRPEGAIRASFGPYSTAGDLEAVSAAVAEAASRA